MKSRKSVEERLRGAAMRLAGKGLMVPGDALSERVPEEGAFALAKLESLHDVPREVEWIDLAGSPHGLHHTVYAARPDVGAVLAGSQTWGRALARLDLSMPAIFDEQVRHLGLEVPRWAASSASGGPLPFLKGGANAFALDDAVLCFGMGLERLLLNAELLEKCAKAFVLAHSTGGRVRRIPWLVRTIANRRLLRDEQAAAECHLRGERPVLKAGY